jgi:hypothetical protein
MGALEGRSGNRISGSGQSLKILLAFSTPPPLAVGARSASRRPFQNNLVPQTSRGSKSPHFLFHPTLPAPTSFQQWEKEERQRPAEPWRHGCKESSHPRNLGEIVAPEGYP